MSFRAHLRDEEAKWLSPLAARRTPVPPVAAEELECRRSAFERATNCLRIEGLTMQRQGPKPIAQAWLRGDISGEEMGAQIRALRGA